MKVRNISDEFFLKTKAHSIEVINSDYASG